MKKIINNRENILIITNILLVVITFWFSYQTLQISQKKFISENRPYLYVNEIKWFGIEGNFFELNIKNPSNFPATFFVDYSISNENGEKVLDNIPFQRNYNYNIFPYEKEKTITLGFNKVELVNKLDLKPKLVISRKGLENVIDTYNSGAKLFLNLSINYTSLVGNLNKPFLYTQKIQIQKIDDKPHITTLEYTAS